MAIAVATVVDFVVDTNPNGDVPQIPGMPSMPTIPPRLPGLPTGLPSLPTGRVHRLPSGGAETWLYRWNSDDELVEVSTPGGERWRYRYDPLGRRIAKQRLAPDGTVAEQIGFVWDASVVTELIHSSGYATTWEYAADGPAPLAQMERPPGGPALWYWVRTDLLGTPTELPTPEGEVARHAAASLWGETPAAPGPSTPLRFPGQYHDPETGLHYNLFRYYDPAIGRFLTADPLRRSRSRRTTGPRQGPAGSP
ncbi:RHS repeat-associated core domain-containing protein [Amycolatopsis acidiphila]|uniref:RHS repeat-associated core domain-containing protein n=1 Tax=Amycolatopsis acidiphila TaxID=715473 RepID=A0A558ACA9_9PSEU|nr:RHS repeat-associated core domain-containing protein [Amycolatopsis acidiphila]